MQSRLVKVAEICLQCEPTHICLTTIIGKLLESKSRELEELLALLITEHVSIFYKLSIAVRDEIAMAYPEVFDYFVCLPADCSAFIGASEHRVVVSACWQPRRTTANPASASLFS